jgi:N-acetylneuraminic acid mutarotase
VTINGKGYYGLGDNGFKNDWWEYDASADSWTQKSNCPAALGGASAFVIGNKAYIVGGFNGSYLNSVYEWNSSTNLWLPKNNFPGGARAYLSSCVINGRGYIVGGNNSTNTFQDIWEYDPSLDQWNFKTNISAGTTGRTRMTSFELASKMYFGLGQTCSSPCVSPAYTNEWFEYNPQSNTITIKNNFPGNTRENASGFAFGDKGYLLFGNSGAAFFTDYWEYDFLQDSWLQKGNYSGSGVSAASATVINNAVYIYGGNTVSGSTQRVLEFKVFSNVCTNNPSTVSLQASSGTSYLWNTGATTQSIIGIPSGDYSVLVNNAGCSSTAYANLAIYPVPSANIAASGPLTFCSGNSVNLTASPASSYLWSNGSATNSITVNTSGSYSVTVTGGGGCTSTSAPVSVISYPGPPVTVVGNPSLAVCQGSSITLNSYGYQSIPFSPVSGTGTGVTLSDDQLSGALPIGFSFSFYNNTYTNFYISSNGFITFGSTSSGCCTGQALPNPTAPNNLISFAWNDLYPPAGGSIEYFTTGSAPNRKLIVKFNAIQHWPGGNPVTAQVILYETSNLIEIHTTLMPTNGTAHTMGIENISGTQAVIYPARNGTNWTATNDAVRFGTGIANYLWNTGSTTSSITTSTAGNYSVTVTDGNNCSATSLPVFLTVNPLPNASIAASGPTTICLGDSVTLTANTSASYLWSTGAVTQSITVFASGNYSVTVSDANGCTKTSAVTTVTVSPCSAPVNLKVYIQGFYKGSGIMEAVIDKQGRPGVCDSLTLELHDIVMPHTLAYSVKNVIDVNGNGTFVFPLAALSNTYYLVVKHRNSMETWSSLPITMNSPAVNYDFTSSAAQSFGSNEANLGGGVFGIYSGDINQDQAINTIDLNQNMADAGIFLTGYLNSDLNGDWMVESADFSLLENNVQQAVVILRP